MPVVTQSQSRGKRKAAILEASVAIFGSVPYDEVSVDDLVHVLRLDAHIGECDLGRALTEEFIRLGHIVIGCGRSEKEIAQLQKQFPAPNDFAAVDVSADGQVAAWAKHVLQSPGTPDLLLNNAALQAFWREHAWYPGG